MTLRGPQLTLAEVVVARTSWIIHCGILTALAIAYLIWSWRLWFPPPGDALNVGGLAALVVLVFGMLYFLVTTLVMVWIARFAGSPVFMHFVPMFALAFVCVDLWTKNASREADAQVKLADYNRRESEKTQVHTCLNVEMEASAGSEIKANLTVVNDCPFQVVLSDVFLMAAKGKSRWILDPHPRLMGTKTEVPAGARHVFFLDDSNTQSRADGSWVWSCQVYVEEPAIPVTLCFDTERVPLCRPFAKETTKEIADSADE